MGCHKQALSTAGERHLHEQGNDRLEHRQIQMRAWQHDEMTDGTWKLMVR